MIAIENKGRLRFIDGDKVLTLQEGFKWFELIYHNEPQDVKKVIDKLREKYLKA